MSKVKKPLSLLMAVVMMLSLVPSSSFALNQDDYVYTYGDSIITNPASIWADTTETTETIRLAAGLNSYRYGNYVVPATPTGIPQTTSNFQSVMYAGETVENPQVVLKIYGINSQTEISDVEITPSNMNGGSFAQTSVTSGTDANGNYFKFVYTMQSACFGVCTVPGGPNSDVVYNIKYTSHGKEYHSYAYSHAEYIYHPASVYMHSTTGSGGHVSNGSLTMFYGAQSKNSYCANYSNGNNTDRAMIDGQNPLFVEDTYGGDTLKGGGWSKPGNENCFMMWTDGYEESVAWWKTNDIAEFFSWSNNRRCFMETFGTNATDGNRTVTTVWVDKAKDHLGTGNNGNLTNGLNLRIVTIATGTNNYTSSWYDNIILANNNHSGFGRSSWKNNQTGIPNDAFSTSDVSNINNGQWTADLAGKTANNFTTASRDAMVAKGAGTTTGNDGYLKLSGVRNGAYVMINMGGVGPTTSQKDANDCWSYGFEYVCNNINDLSSSGWSGSGRISITSSNQSVRFRVYDTTALRQVITAIDKGANQTITVSFNGQYGGNTSDTDLVLVTNKGTNPQAEMYSEAQWTAFKSAYDAARKALSSFDVGVTSFNFVSMDAINVGVEQQAVDTAVANLINAYNALSYQPKGKIVVHHYLNGTTTKVAPDEVFIGFDANGNLVKEGSSATVATNIQNGATFTLRAATVEGNEVVGNNSVTGYAAFIYNNTEYGVTVLKNSAGDVIGEGGEFVFYYEPASQDLIIYTKTNPQVVSATVKTGATPDFATLLSGINKLHYINDGLYENSDFSGSAINQSTWAMPAQNANLYMKWTPKPVKIHVNSVDGALAPLATTGNESAAVTPTENSDGIMPVTFTSMTAPTAPEGYSFVAFYKDAACTQAVEFPLTASYTIDEENVDGYYAITEGATVNTVEIYARFVNLGSKLYFDPNGGTMPAGYEGNEYTFTTGTPINYPIPTRAGYTFKGWATENGEPINSTNVASISSGAWSQMTDGKVTAVENGTITMSSSLGFTAYAVWEPVKIKAIFRLNIPAAETSPMNSQDSIQQPYYTDYFDSDQIATADQAPPTPRRFGYTFNYWANGNRKFTFDGKSKFPILAEGQDTFTLTAVWASATSTAFAELTSYIKYAGTDYITDNQHASYGATKDAAPGDVVSVQFVVQGNFYSGSQSYIFGYNTDFYEEITGVDVFDLNENNYYIDAIKAEAFTIEQFNTAVQGVFTNEDPEVANANVKYIQVAIDPNVQAMSEYKTVAMSDSTYILELHLKIKDTATGSGSVWVATETMRTPSFLMGDTFISYTPGAESFTHVETDRVNFDTSSIVSTVTVKDEPDPDYTITLRLPTEDGVVKGVFADGTTAAKTYTGRAGSEILTPYTTADGASTFGFPTPTREGYHLVGWYLVNGTEIDETDEWTEGYYATEEQNGKTYEAKWAPNEYTLSFFGEDKVTSRGTVPTTYDAVGITPPRYPSGAVTEVLGWIAWDDEATVENLVDFTTYRVTGDQSFYALVKYAQKDITITATKVNDGVSTQFGSIVLTKEIQKSLGLELRVNDILKIVDAIPETPESGVQYLLASDLQSLMAGTYTYVNDEGTTVTVPAGITNANDRANYEIIVSELPVSHLVVSVSANNTLNVNFQGKIVTETFSTGATTYRTENGDIGVTGTYTGSYETTTGVRTVEGIDEEREPIDIDVPVTIWTVSGRYGDALNLNDITTGVVPPEGFKLQGFTNSSSTFKGLTHDANFSSINITIVMYNTDGTTIIRNTGKAFYQDGKVESTNFTQAAKSVTLQTGHKVGGWKIAKVENGVNVVADNTVYNTDFYVNTVWDYVINNEGTYELHFVPYLTAQDYNITYKTVKNGTETTVTSLGQKVTFGTSYNLAAEPSQTGYTFSGWYTTAECTGTPVAAGTEQTLTTEGATWYGKFTANEYTVTFDANGGESTTTVDVAFDSDITAPTTNPTKVGHTFVGWAKTSTATTALASLGKLTTEGATFYAVYSVNDYSVKFYKENDDVTAGNVYDEFTKAYGASFTATDFPANPTKSGYTFAGWTITNDETGVATTVIADDIATYSSTIPAANCTAVANWDVNEYTLTYKGDVNGDGTAEVLGTQTYEYGEAVIAIADPTKEGYVFAGWTPAVPDTMPAYDYEVEAAFTKEEYTFSFSIGDATGTAPAAISAQYGDTITLPEANGFSKEGYSLEGWYNGATKVGAPGDQWTVTDMGNDGTTAELTANWVINQYTITFAEEDGTAIGTITKDYMAAIDASEYADFTPIAKTGYTFSGWTVPETMPAYDQTIKASYTKNKYNLIFKDEAGTTVLGTYEYEYEATIAEEDYADVVIPEKTGYTFDGWSPEVPAAMPANEYVVLATYKVNNYTVTYQTKVGEDGVYEELTTQVYEYGETITAATAPAKDGYTFSGWTGIPADGKMPANNITVSGTYSIDNYKVTYVSDGTQVDQKDVVYNTTLETVVPEQPTKAGYDFVKWNYANASDEAYTGTTMPAFDLTATAEWVIHEYTLTFDYNGATAPADAPTTLTVNYNQAITLPVDNIVKTGYTFNGWYATAEDAAAGTNRLPAVWNVPAQAANGLTVAVYVGFAQNQYTLEFVVETGATPVNSINYNYGDEITAANAPTTAKAGKDFKGWYEDADFATPFAWGTLPDLGENNQTKTLYAKFEDHVYENGVIFVQPDQQAAGYHGAPQFENKTPYENASGEPWTISATNGQAISDYPTDAPEVANYIFVGWVYDGVTYTADGANGTVALSDFRMPAIDADEVVYFVPAYEKVEVTLNIDVEAGSDAAIVDKEHTETEAITGYIYNVGYKQRVANVDSQLVVDGDGLIVITPSKANVCGTGAKVELFDLEQSSSTPVETYYIVVFGDVDGSAACNSTDTALILDEINKTSDESQRTWGLASSASVLSQDQQNKVYCYNRAADAYVEGNGAGVIDNNDYEVIIGYVLGYVTFDKATGLQTVTLYKGTPEEYDTIRYKATAI